MSQSKPTKDGIEFGRRVRAIRTARGLSLHALGYRTHISRGYLGQLERGERNPSLATIVRLVDALEVDAGLLLWDLHPPADGTAAPKMESWAITALADEVGVPESVLLLGIRQYEGEE